MKTSTVAESLTIWLDGQRVAEIAQPREKRLRLAYTDDALDAYSLGTPLLSIELPLTPVPYSHGPSIRFLEGLLPEGQARQAVAEHFDLKASDTFGLLREIGRDSAGALVILPSSEPLPPRRVANASAALGDAELASIIANLRRAPFGVDDNFRISLAGVQEKLVLTRVPGGWARPDVWTPSTHILKPERADLTSVASTVDNEAFCMEFARALGLPVARVERLTLADRRFIVIERYDRAGDRGGITRRIHQEDFCQALGVLPAAKYEEDGGPPLARVAATLNNYIGIAAVEALFRATAVNLLLLNGDAHAKNFSLLHPEPGQLAFAPLYDLMSTQMYGVKKLAMSIDSLQLMDRVTGARLINEAASWRLQRARARAILHELLSAAPEAAAEAAAAIDADTARVTAVVHQQIEKLQPED